MAAKSKWEYRTASADRPFSAKQLNEEFGPKGWELVDTIGPDADGKFIVYFKREIKPARKKR